MSDKKWIIKGILIILAISMLCLTAVVVTGILNGGSISIQLRGAESVIEEN